MKNISGILRVLKLLIKYSAYIVVVIDILQYAHDKITTISKEHEREVDNV